MPISAWSTDPATNNSISVAEGGMPENLTRPKDVNDVIRQQMADHKTQWIDAEWFNHGDSGLAQASSSSFTLTGDVTDEYESDRRIKCYDYATLYGTIASSSYSAPDTTVNVNLDSGSLTASLTSVALAILKSTNLSMPPILPAISGNLTIGGTSSLSGAVVAKTSMTIEGTLTASATAVFKSVSIFEGALSAADTVSISGATVLNTTLNVQGTTTLSGVAIAKSALTAQDTFTVSGAMVAKTSGLFEGALTAASTFTANGAAVMKSGFTGEGSATISGAFVALTTGVFNGALSASTTFTASGATTLKTTLNVLGNTTLSGAAKLNSTLTVAGNTTLSGATVLSTTLNVQGNTTLSGNAVAKGTLLVEGALSAGSTFTASGASVFKSALTSESTATISGALVAKTIFEIPNSATPTLNSNGQIALDTTVTDFTGGLFKYYSGAEYGAVSMPITQFSSPTDGYVVAYNAASDIFELVAQSGVGGIGNVVEDTTPQLGGDLDANGFDIQFDTSTGIRDDSDNEQLLFTKVASAVNYFNITNAATGNDPILAVAGSDSNIGMILQAIGTGKYHLKSTSSGQTQLVFYEDTDNGTNTGTLTLPASMTGDRTWSLSDYDVNFQPLAFAAYDSAGTSCSHNTETRITAETEILDVGGCYDNATNYRWTPTRACIALVGHINGFNTMNAAAPLDIIIKKNGGGNSVVGTYECRAANTYYYPQVMALVAFNGTTDYVEAYAKQQGGGTETSGAGADRGLFFGFALWFT